jgi:hypothetical protein
MQDDKIVWRVHRPEFENALEDLRRGVAANGQPIDGLIVYDIDRLTRDHRNLEDAIDIVQRFGRPIIDTTGTIDLLTDNGRAAARLLVTIAAKSSADSGRRQARKARAMQQAGIPGGGPVPYGWAPDRRTLSRPEADILKAGAQRLLEGTPPVVLVHEWNDAGIPTATGKVWTLARLKETYRHPRMCGIRGRLVTTPNPNTKHGTRSTEIVRDADGKPVRGQWEAILGVDEWQALIDIIGDRYQAATTQNTRRYLLSGIMRCGKCGKRLRGANRYGKNTDMTAYSCQGRTAGGCGGVGITGPITEQLVIAAVLAKFEEQAETTDSEQAPISEWAGQAELDWIHEQIREATTAWKDKGMSGARYFATITDLEQQEQALNADRNAWSARSRPTVIRPTDLREQWHTYSLAQQRAWIGEALTAVIVKPTQNRRRVPAAERLELVWNVA